MLTESLLLGIVLLAFRRQLFGFARYAQYKGVALPMIAFVIEFGAGSLLSRGGEGVVRQIIGLTFGLELICYGLLMAFILANHRQKGFKAMAFGVVLNAAVVIANGGFMPVEGETLKAMGFDETYKQLSNLMLFGHELMSENTKLSLLGDIIHIKPPYPFPKSVSIGDWIMGFGVLYHLVTYKNPSGLSSREGEEAKHDF